MRRLAALAALLVTIVAPARALADHSQLSVMQDDQFLLDSPTPVVEHALSVMQGLGVQMLRVNVLWNTIAPDPLSRTMPAHFDAADQAAYPASGWAPYDRLVALAPLYGMRVQLNLTAPGPLWAMGRHPPTTRAANHWWPNPTAFFDFVYAIGERYSGAPGGQPRVSQWSIWNEPNQPGWLAPQSLKVKGHELARSPRIYRALADGAYAALYYSGHTADTILIGETAPEGYDAGGFYTPLTPLPFLRDLYCVDRHSHPLRGNAATAQGCPVKGPASRFAASHPALFRAAGYAHHPYYFFHAPSASAADPNFIPIADIGRLTRFLDAAFRTYGVRRRLPIYFTEYGYQTRPPDPYQVVTLGEQATYLNEADYIAWRNPRVRSVAQFLLYDAAPNPLYKPTAFDYWDTFQTGLLFHDGGFKPSFFAYRLPIWIPHPRFRGAVAFIWGQVRPAHSLASAQRVSILWRPARGRYRTIATALSTPGTGYLTARVRLPGDGAVKLAWTGPSGTTFHSRAVTVTETR